MKKHNIMRIEQTAQLEIVKFMHKYFNNMLPHAFNDFFQHNIEIAMLVGHSRKLRYFLNFAELN